MLSQFVFDSFDVVIWQYTASSALEQYTFYDKFFDSYQLTIMALVAYRWKDAYPKVIALRLFAFRMVGFILYEITRQRIFFFLFPNLFSLYFLGYYLCERYGKSHWFLKKKYLSRLLIVLLILKMPQEYTCTLPKSPLGQSSALPLLFRSEHLTNIIIIDHAFFALRAKLNQLTAFLATNQQSHPSHPATHRIA